MLSCKNITKVYNPGAYETKALKGIDFSMEEGEFVAIMGPSGSGKSTFMHILGMLDSPTSGEYFFDGQDVSKLSDEELAYIRLEKIGFVFQAFNLLPRTSVLRNVTLPFVYEDRQSFQKERKERAIKALQDVGLSDKDLWSHLSNELSGGQMQRVSIARALVTNPKLLFADEPTGNLDSKSGEVIMETFVKLNKEGRTILLITHEQEIADFADRIIHLKDGLIEKDVVNREKRESAENLRL